MLKNLPVLIIICLTAMLAGSALGAGAPPNRVPTTEERARGQWIPEPDDILITPLGISMPLERIILARRGTEHCALKFTRTWSGETIYDRFGSYEFFHQGDSTGDFSKSNTSAGTGELYFPRPRMWMGIGYYKGVTKDSVQCGGMKFKSFGVGNIRFGDTELAPTPWKAIADVSIHDPRIRWYQKESSRKSWIVPVDLFWAEGWEEKGTLCIGVPK